MAAIDRGVAVSLLIDGFGSSDARRFFRRARPSAAARFCRFHPRYGRRYLLRNHQKLALADAEGQSPCSSAGSTSPTTYFGTVAEGAWRDLGLLVEGPPRRGWRLITTS